MRVTTGFLEMKKYEKSIVASGHKLVSEAAGEILKAGGNAFDAVVTAGFVSAVVEPALTSLGGGGFMLGHDSKTGQNKFFDFFVDTPGKGAKYVVDDPHFFPITVDFSGTLQDFNVGLGSVAVPGTLKGLLHIHKKLGSMPLSDILQPAKQHAIGHTLNQQQAHFLQLLHPIMTLAAEGNGLYNSKGEYIQEGQVLRNPELANFMELLVHEGEDEFYKGEIARNISSEMLSGGGLLTLKDLAEFEVIEREPFVLPYKDYQLLTSPEPSMGGALIGLSLSLLSKMNIDDMAWGDIDHITLTTALMQEVESLRENGVSTPSKVAAFLDNKNVFSHHQANIKQFSRGTTHISIADKNGNCASMTCSNGEGSGYFAPKTGIMLNNMMGEDDLHPNGFHSSPAGQRVFSMMSPSMLLKDDDVKLVIGSGGSKRIRTAISQVLSQVVDFGRGLQQSVDAPRLYWDGKFLQMEPNFPITSLDHLPSSVPVNIWEKQDVYFGGVHAVIPGKEGAGDKRRGGSVVEVD